MISLSCLASLVHGQAVPIPEPKADVLNEAEWNAVDNAVHRAKEWLASRQQRDGSFPTLPLGQPGVTSLCTMAMMAGGDVPGPGERGERLRAAIDYVLRTQKPNGLLALVGPAGEIDPLAVSHTVGQTGYYNHGIAGLMLSEAYAMTDREQSERIHGAIEKALKITLQEQRRPKQRQVDRGGWRYLDKYDHAESDLSVVGWQLMFLRSAKNAGFDVPKQAIDDAVECVQRHFSEDMGSFTYTIEAGSRNSSRAMVGAGILAFAHAGLHDAPEAIQAGEHLLRRPFTRYNQPEGGLDRYHYSLFQCSQAAYQLGGRYWEQFYPPTARTLIENQNSDGSWDPETAHGDGKYGNAYTTALVLLSLGAPNQLLPIYQR